MACLITPTTAAIIASGVGKKIPAQYHFERLIAMLWGGSIWLTIEHVYRGEVVPYPPFFTAGTDRIVAEVIRVGFPMTLATVAVWLLLPAIEKYSGKTVLKPHFFGLMASGAMIMVLVDKILA